MVGTSAKSIQEIDAILKSYGIATQEMTIGGGKKPGIGFNLPPIIAEKVYIQLLWSIGVGCSTKKERDRLLAA